MELTDFIVAIGITFLMVFFLNNMLSTFYKAPTADYSKCYTSSSDCYTTLRAKCSPSNYTCYSAIYSSQEYGDCTNNLEGDRDKCYEKQGAAVKNYQLSYYMILSLLGLILIVGGFYLLNLKTIGGGFIGAGVLTLLFANLFASLSVLVSSLMGGLSSLSGLTGLATSSGATSSKALPYLNLIFSLIGLVVLIVFAYFKIEKNREGK
jgi:hypothetical protein